MPLSAYVDSSTINRAVDANVPAGLIRGALDQIGFEPATGLHTVFELARAFLEGTETSRLRGSQLFTFLQDLDPSYQPDVPALVAAEIEKLRLGTAVLPFLNQVNLASTRVEVGRLANGYFDDRARAFIENKEADRKNSQQSFGLHLGKIQSARSAGVLKGRLRTYADVWAYFERRGDIPRLIADVVHHSVSSAEAAELANRLGSFPAIAAATRANVYLNFLMLANLAAPGRDKLDDFVHCIEASYCSALLSADAQQLRALTHICPQIRPVSWGEIRGSAGAA